MQGTGQVLGTKMLDLYEANPNCVLRSELYMSPVQGLGWGSDSHVKVSQYEVVYLIRIYFKPDPAQELSIAPNNLALKPGCLPSFESYIAEGIVVICKLFSCINSFW